MRPPVILAALLLAVCLAVMALRLSAGVSVAAMAPTIEYLFDVHVAMDLHHDEASARLYVPMDRPGQMVRSERIQSDTLSYQIGALSGDRVATWQARNADGHRTGSYSAIVQVHAQQFRIPTGIPVPERYSDDLLAHLQPSEAIQANDPEIRALAERLAGADGMKDTAALIRQVYDFVHDEIRNSSYENTLDAVTTMRWKEAFCGGKSRLLAALLRAENIPARLVGGIILTPGAKRTTHAWVEAWVNGTWIPLDALNGHFAERPGNYLVLYHGDNALISRTANINFQYHFKIKKWRTSPDDLIRPDTSFGISNTYPLWHHFKKAEISLNLLRILLMAPVGVLTLLFLRNIVGLRLVGTFMPVLMAVALRDTGLGWGILVFVTVIIGALLVRWPLDRLQLLHLPRLAVLLTVVVVIMLGIAYWSVSASLIEAAHVTMFPIAVLTLTTEGIFLNMQERGVVYALRGVGNTLMATALAYVVIENYFLQALVFLFPEVLLAVFAIYILIGRYASLRLLEFVRFRLLAREDAA